MKTATLNGKPALFNPTTQEVAPLPDVPFKLVRTDAAGIIGARFAEGDKAGEQIPLEWRSLAKGDKVLIMVGSTAGDTFPA